MRDVRKGRTILHLREVLHHLQGPTQRQAGVGWPVLLPRLQGSLRCAFGEPVSAEPNLIQMQIEADARLAAAAGAAARYFADLAGLESAAIARLQTAVINACKQAFTHLTTEHPWLEVKLTRLADRIEVALSNQGRQSAAGENDRASIALGGVDDVQYETNGKVTIMRLTKYITPTTLQY